VKTRRRGVMEEGYRCGSEKTKAEHPCTCLWTSGNYIRIFYMVQNKQRIEENACPFQIPERSLVGCLRNRNWRWCGGTATDFHWWGTRFESQTGRPLTRLSPFKQIPLQYFEQATTVSFPINY
jgi:hypothetical protein